ncbi:MAG: hypothetical protein J7K83_00315 [Candidatus Aenigmarchaeota archaeon]|nr:hypothetical protein [Candidatus Aenigmarchaeota archaeon]
MEMVTTYIPTTLIAEGASTYFIAGFVSAIVIFYIWYKLRTAKHKSPLKV